MFGLVMALAVQATAKTPHTVLASVPVTVAAKAAPKATVKATPKAAPKATPPEVPHVGFLSQFKNISDPNWKSVGCGITSLAMLINYYKPHTVSVDKLLAQGLKIGAYDDVAGWTYDGLLTLGKKYGLSGTYYDIGSLSKKAAIMRFKKLASAGPVILAVHYQFDPKSDIPHLIVIEGVSGDNVYYNDPAFKSGRKIISMSKLAAGWGSSIIVMRPVKKAAKPTKLALK